jgi:hypothetical protein
MEFEKKQKKQNKSHEIILLQSTLAIFFDIY